MIIYSCKFGEARHYWVFITEEKNVRTDNPKRYISGLYYHYWSHICTLKIKFAFCIVTKAYSNFACIQSIKTSLNLFTLDSRHAARILSLVIRPAEQLPSGPRLPLLPERSRHSFLPGCTPFLLCRAPFHFKSRLSSLKACTVGSDVGIKQEARGDSVMAVAPRLSRSPSVCFLGISA